MPPDLGSAIPIGLNMRFLRSSVSVIALLLLLPGAVLASCLPLRDSNSAQASAPPYATYVPPPTYVQPPPPPPAPSTPPPAPSPSPPPAPSPAPPATGWFPIPGMPGWGLPIPPGYGSPPAAAPPAATTPGPVPTSSAPPVAAACIINPNPQTWKTTALLTGNTGGVCGQQPRIDGNLTIRSTSPTMAHLDWNNGEHFDDASFDPASCTITRAPPGKTEQGQGITGHATYTIKVDASGHLSGTANVIVDIPFSSCQAQYSASGTK